MHRPPQIAVLTADILTGLGLKSLLERIIPAAEVLLLEGVDQLPALEAGGAVFHYFVSQEVATARLRFFRNRARKTILLVRGDSSAIEGMHSLNIGQSEQDLVREILRMYGRAHAHGAAARATTESDPLTRREKEVLQLIVGGLLNKQIADRLGIGLTTVITHRRNLMRKLGIRSVAHLTIYAVTHGITDARTL